MRRSPPTCGAAPRELRRCEAVTSQDLRLLYAALVHWYEPDVVALEALQQRQPAPPDPVVFYGSSSIRLWDSLLADFPEYPVVNRGFGGSTMTACSWFFWRLVRPLAPRTLVLYAGDNDLADGDSPENVLSQLGYLLSQLDDCRPDARLALLTVKLSPARLHLAPRIAAVNEGYRSIVARRRGAVLVDVHAAMLSDGRPQPEHYQADGLHLSSAGYAVWRDEVRRHAAGLF